MTQLRHAIASPGTIFLRGQHFASSGDKVLLMLKNDLKMIWNDLLSRDTQLRGGTRKMSGDNILRRPGTMLCVC